MRHSKIDISLGLIRTMEAVQGKLPELFDKMLKYDAEKDGITIQDNPAAGMPQFRETLRKYDPEGNLTEQHSKIVDPDDVYMDVKFRARRLGWIVKTDDDGVITMTRVEGVYGKYRKNTITFEPIIE